MKNTTFTHFDCSYPSLDMFTNVVEEIALLFMPPFNSNGNLFKYNLRYDNGTIVLNNVVLHFVFIHSMECTIEFV